MISLANNQAFKWNLDFCQGFEQGINTFATNDLPGENDQVAIAKRSARRFVPLARNRDMHENLLRIEAVADQFLPRIIGINDQARALLVQPNLPPLFAIAHILELAIGASAQKSQA